MGLLKQVGTVAALVASVSPSLALAGHGSCVHRAAYVKQFVAAVPVYYAVGSGLREEAIATRAAEQAVAKALAENDAKWEQKVSQLFGSLRASMISGKGTFTFQAGSDDVQPTPQPTPVDPVPQPVTDGPAFTEAFTKIVQTKCAKCHGADKPQKAIDPGNTDAARASLIFLKTFSADPAIQMPPPPGDLTEQEREQIFLWASQSVKQSKGQ